MNASQHFDSRRRPVVGIVFLSLMACVGCDLSPPESAPVVDRLEILADETRLLGEGDILKLRVLAYDEGGFPLSPEGVVWNVSDPRVADVSSTGTLTAVGVGSALVSAAVDGVIGVRRIDVVPRYVLPYKVGNAHRVAQAFGGAFSHTGSFRYSYDFDMSVGTKILASRSGIVAQVEESFQDGDNELGHENFVIIDHGDGTFARYLHLTENGALVEPRESISAGQVVGQSGNTGFSTLPHLHFDVTEGCGLPLPDCPTIEYWFANADPHQPPAGTLLVAQ